MWLPLSLLLALSVGSVARAEVSFSREIAPILLKRCTGCHGERTQLGGYRAHTFRSLMKPGASKGAVVVAGKPEASRLFKLLVDKNPATRMPKADDPLTAPQIALFRRWITEGAKYDGGDPNAPLGSLLGPREHPAAPASYRAPVPVLAVVLAPGGRELYAGGYHEVTVWDAATGKLLRRIPRLPQRIQALAFSPDGKFLLVAGGTPGEYGEVALVETVTGKRVRVLDTFPDIVLAAAFNADGRRVIAGGADTSVRAYDAVTGKRLWMSKVHSDWVTGVTFSPDERFAASSSKDKTVKVYDGRTGALFTTYNGHNRNYGQYRGQFPVYAVQFLPMPSLAETPAPAEMLACSAGGGPTLQLWDPLKAREENGTAADMEERFAKESHARHIEHGLGKEIFAMTIRAGQVFAASADGALKQFDLASRKEARAYPVQADWLFAVDFDPVSGRVATGSYSGEVRVWDSRTGQPVSVFKAQPR